MNANEPGAVELFCKLADRLTEEMRVFPGQVKPHVICASLNPIDLVYEDNDDAASRLDNQPVVGFMPALPGLAVNCVAYPHVIACSHFTSPLKVCAAFKE